MIRFSTAGESHGEALIALVSGIPAGVSVDKDQISRGLEIFRLADRTGSGHDTPTAFE